MKSKDFIPVVILAFISAILSFVVSNIVISSDDNRSQRVEVVDSISTDFQRPPQEYFNENAVNPTQTIIIGQDQSQQPFGGEQ